MIPIDDIGIIQLDFFYLKTKASGSGFLVVMIYKTSKSAKIQF
jgi:hypothetical protein